MPLRRQSFLSIQVSSLRVSKFFPNWHHTQMKELKHISLSERHSNSPALKSPIWRNYIKPPLLTWERRKKEKGDGERNRSGKKRGYLKLVVKKDDEVCLYLLTDRYCVVYLVSVIRFHYPYRVDWGIYASKRILSSPNNTHHPNKLWGYRNWGVWGSVVLCAVLLGGERVRCNSTNNIKKGNLLHLPYFDLASPNKALHGLAKLRMKLGIWESLHRRPSLFLHPREIPSVDKYIGHLISIFLRCRCEKPYCVWREREWVRVCMCVRARKWSYLYLMN